MKEGQITHIIFDHDGTLVDTSSYYPRLYPGIEKMLAHLHKQGIKLFVWTARDSSSTRRILESFNLFTFFKDMSCGNDAPSKPNTFGPKLMLGEDISKNLCMIGDSPQDMLGAKAINAHAIGALWCHGDERVARVLKDNGADICFYNVDECYKYLLGKI